MDDFKWLVSSLLVLAGLAFGFWRYREDRRKQLLVDLQGDKDAVAAVAMGVWRGRFPRWPRPFAARHRFELFEALCLAAVFQSSGRSRSVIYGALAHAAQQAKYRAEIKETVDRITMSVSRTWGYTNLNQARRRLIALRAALRLDADVRVRLDTFELDGYTREHDWPPDQRLRHDAFGWADLEGAVREVGNLVVVGSTEPPRAIISLDYDRAGPRTGGTGIAPSVETRASAQVSTAKGGGPSGPTADATESLAEQLAAVVKSHRVYRRATCLAGVPGRKHDFSGKLAVSVARKTGKKFVPLVQASDSTIAEDPQFKVADPTAVTGDVIVVDDVYRSGRTLQAATAALRKAGAEEVLGLTATCTISASGQAAVYGCDEPPTGPGRR